MQRKHNEFKVGVTVTMVAALFMAVIMFVGKWDSMFGETRELFVSFDHRLGVQGLRGNDPVSIGGVNVGRVKEIRLVQASDREGTVLNVIVVAEIPDYVTIYRDAKVKIGTKFVGEGGTLIVVDAGGKEPVLEKGEALKGLATASLGDLTSKFSSLVDQVTRQLDEKNPESLLGKLQKSLDDANAISANIRMETDAKVKEALMAKIHKMVGGLNEITASLRAELDRNNGKAVLARVDKALDSINESLAIVNSTLKDAKPKLTATVDHVQNTARRLDEKISTAIAAELDRGNDSSLLAGLHDVLTKAQAGMKHFEHLAGTADEMLAVNRENLQDMIDDLGETSSHLKATAKELRLNPWRLLYKPDKPEIEYANLMAAARSFSDAAEALDDTNTKLQSLLAIEGKDVTADDPMLIKIREKIKDSYCEFEEAQKKLWELLKSSS